MLNLKEDEINDAEDRYKFVLQPLLEIHLKSDFKVRV